MEVYEAIERRRTIRIFTKGVSEEQLRKIILAGTKAPSGWNCQPWEFIIIDDHKIIDQLAELKYQLLKDVRIRDGEGQHEIEERALTQKNSFQNASIVAVCAKSGPESQSIWLCIENMSLAAVANGLGSGIVTYWDKQKEEVENLLGLPESYEIAAIMKFGVPGEEGFPRDKNPVTQRRPEFSWIHRNRF